MAKWARGTQSLRTASFDLESDSAQVRERRSYAFGGALYAWPFHLGVAAYLQENCLIQNDARLYATSSGCLAASLLACDVDVRRVGLQAALQSTDAHIGRVGPYFKPSQIKQSLKLFTDVLPTNAHELATRKLFLTVTQLPWMTPRIVSRYRSRDALIEGLMATMALPGHGVPLALRTSELKLGWVLDGGLRTSRVRDPRVGWETIQIASWKADTRIGRRVSRVDVAPSQSVPLAMRFMLTPRPRRMNWFDHGYQRAADRFAASNDTQGAACARR